MNIRRAILALALTAGIVPAFAQVPAPVPALPDTERRTTYAITGTTCACSVGFALYGDSTDYANWVEVWLNGVRVNFNDATFGWTITSPSGSLGSIARPITDAALTFTNVQTGTVQIVGARRPRRTSQFSESQGVSARSFNQVLTDIISQNREIWDKNNDMTGRGLFSQPGNTVGPLPLPALCAGGFLGFDATGLNPVCRSSGIGSGNVTGPGTSTSGHFALFNNSTGSLLSDGGAPAASATTDTTNAANITSGTLPPARLPIAAITGGTITGLPTPTNASDAATKSYVDATAAGLTILAPSTLATAAILPNTPTYANGASGVGATLTAGSNSTLTVDGTVAGIGAVVLVNNQASAFQNGIYTVTTAGSGAAAWVLTRATYFDQAAEMLKGSYTFITSGSANLSTAWVLTATTTTVGTTAVNFNQFSGVTASPPCTPARSIGFVGDGATANDTAFTNWWAGLPSTGGCVEFGVGKFLFSSAVAKTMAAARQTVTIKGMGSDLTTLYWAAGGGMKITQGSSLNSVHIRDLTFSTGAAATGNALTLDSAGIALGIAQLSDVINVAMRGDDFNDISGNVDYWAIGLQIRGWASVNVFGLTTYGLIGAPGTAGGGIGLNINGYAGGQSVVINIYGSTFSWHNVAAELDSYWEGVTFSQCNFQGEVGSVGIFTPASQTNAGPLLNITNSQFNSGGQQIDLVSAVDEVVIIGNTITTIGNGNSGIILSTGQVPIIKGNLINHASGTSNVGIQANSNFGIIEGNVIQNVATGVTLLPSSSGVNVSQNVYPGVTTQVSNLGAGNSVGVATK